MIFLLLSLALQVIAHEHHHHHKEAESALQHLYLMMTGDCCASKGNPHKKLVELLIKDTKADVLFAKLDEQMKPLSASTQAILGTGFC